MVALILFVIIRTVLVLRKTKKFLQYRKQSTPGSLNQLSHMTATSSSQQEGSNSHLHQEKDKDKNNRSLPVVNHQVRRYSSSHDALNGKYRRGSEDVNDMKSIFGGRSKPQASQQDDMQNGFRRGISLRECCYCFKMVPYAACKCAFCTSDLEPVTPVSPAIQKEKKGFGKFKFEVDEPQLNLKLP
jgi:hypothetical protein